MKSLMRGMATLAISPALGSFWLRSAILGRDRALEGSTEALGLIPGLLGQYLRRAFLRQTLAHCHPTATVEYGTVFSQSGTRLDRNSYVGPSCHLGLVHVEADVLIAAGVHIPSGAATHGIQDPSVPIREQPGVRQMIRIGQGTWIGSAAVILADVGRETVVGAGSVVTRTIPDRVVAVGNPARVIKSRDGSTPPSSHDSQH